LPPPTSSASTMSAASRYLVSPASVIGVIPRHHGFGAIILHVAGIEGGIGCLSRLATRGD
jgi:hypothetical protein